jgi:hypothetical protein
MSFKVGLAFFMVAAMINVAVCKEEESSHDYLLGSSYVRPGLYGSSLGGLYGGGSTVIRRTIIRRPLYHNAEAEHESKSNDESEASHNPNHNPNHDYLLGSSYVRPGLYGSSLGGLYGGGSTVIRRTIIRRPLYHND